MSIVESRLSTFCTAAIILLAGPAPQTAAFAPTERSRGYEVPLPFYETLSRSGPAGAHVAAALSDQIGGEWLVSFWNRQAGTPHLIVGSGIDIAAGLGSDAVAEQYAREVLERSSAALGLDVASLELSEVSRGLGKVAVHLRQVYEGLDVYRGRALAIFTDSGRLFVLGADYFSDISISPVPSLTAERAVDIACSDLPCAPSEDALAEDPSLLILPVPVGRDAVDHHLVWRLAVRTTEPLGHWVTHVDAHNGEIVWRYNAIQLVDFIGDCFTTPLPGNRCNEQGMHGIEHAWATIEGIGEICTDANGHWEIPYGGSEPRLFHTSLDGAYCRVENADGYDAVYLAEIEPGVPHAMTWHDYNSQLDERTTFDAVNDIHNFFQLFAPEFAYASTFLIAIVSRNDEYCPRNAWYDPNDNTINFCREDYPAANTGEMQDVVCHEYGHGVQRAILGVQGEEGLGEGNADVLANLITGDPRMGLGIDLDQVCEEAYWRNSDNTLVYPDDVVGQEIHAAGRVIAGFHWDAMELLQALYGEATGTIMSAERWHYGRVLMQPLFQPMQVLATFIADDDDGNILNGTPHFNILCEAAANHGFLCPGDVFVDFEYVGEEHGTYQHPYNTLQEGIDEVTEGRRLVIMAGSTSDRPTIGKPMTIEGRDGLVVIGN